MRFIIFLYVFLCVFAPPALKILVQFQIQTQNIYPRLAENAELSAFGKMRHDIFYIRFAHPALTCHTRNLKFGSGGRDVRV